MGSGCEASASALSGSGATVAGVSSSIVPQRSHCSAPGARAAPQAGQTVEAIIGGDGETELERRSGTPSMSALRSALSRLSPEQLVSARAGGRPAPPPHAPR